MSPDDGNRIRRFLGGPSLSGGGGPADIHARLLAERLIFLTGPLDDTVATSTIASLLQLGRASADKEVRIYLNSPGGSVRATLAIYDALVAARCPVATYAVGQCAGTAVLLLAAGTKGRRFALPHARFHFAEIGRGALEASASDLAIASQEVTQAKKAYFEALAKHTGQPVAKLEEATNTFFGSREAVTWGVVDGVLDELP